MELKHDVPLRHFEFWSGAEQRARHLTWEQLDQIEFELEQLYPEGMTDTQVNDLFWFEEDFIAECIGYRSWDAFMEEIEGEED